MSDILKPGDKAPNSGQYLVVGPRGGSKDVEVTSTKGNTLPPTSQPGWGYVLLDPTNNASGLGK